jgi:hypothetical protein
VAEGYVRLGSELFLVVPTEQVLSLSTLSEAIPVARAVVERASRDGLAELGISQDLDKEACVIELARRLATREIVIATTTSPLDIVP